MPSTQSSGSLQGAGFALLAFAVFSSHDVIVKFLGGSYSPFQILFFSGLLGFPFVTLMMIGDQSAGNLRPVHPWWIAARCLATMCSALGAFFAFSQLPLAQVYAILFAAPLIITILAIPILGETVRLRRWAAVIVGLVGVLIVLQPGNAELSLGHLAALVSAIAGATNSVIVRKIGREERSVVLLLYPMLVSFVVLGAALAFVYKPMPIAHFGAVTLIALLAFAAMLCLIRAYRLSEAVIVAPMQYSQILWASAFGYFIYGETLDRSTVIGAGVIIASGIYILLRESSGTASKNTPVLQTRTRAGTGNTLRVGLILDRAAKETMDKPE